MLLKRRDGSTLAATVNAHTGRVLTQNMLPLEVLQVGPPPPPPYPWPHKSTRTSPAAAPAFTRCEGELRHRFATAIFSLVQGFGFNPKPSSCQALDVPRTARSRRFIWSSSSRNVNCVLHAFHCQVLEVPRTVREGAAEQHLFLLVGRPPAAGGAPAVSVLPDTEAACAAAAAAAPAMTFWQADRASGATVCAPSGFRVSRLGGDAANVHHAHLVSSPFQRQTARVSMAGELRGWGLGGGLQAEERWAAGRPAAAPALLAVVPRSPGEPLHTAAKASLCWRFVVSVFPIASTDCKCPAYPVPLMKPACTALHLSRGAVLASWHGVPQPGALRRVPLLFTAPSYPTTTPMPVLTVAERSEASWASFWR